MPGLKTRKRRDAGLKEKPAVEATLGSLDQSRGPEPAGDGQSNINEAAAYSQLAEDRIRDLSRGPTQDDDVVRPRFAMTAFDRADDHGDVTDTEETQETLRLGRKTRISLDGDDAGTKPCQNGRAVTCAGTNFEDLVTGRDVRGLNEARECHRFHEIATVAKRQIIVDIGIPGVLRRDEALPRDRLKGRQNPTVGDFVRPKLGLDHVRADLGGRHHVPIGA